MHFITFFLILLISTQNVSASCGSQAFNSWAILDQSYPVGAEAMQTSYNWIDDQIYTHTEGIFGKMHQMIQTAKKNVYLQTWHFSAQTKPALYLADAIRKLHQKKIKSGDRNVVHFWLLINIISLQNEEGERRKMDRYIKAQGLNLEGIEIHIGYFKANLLGANHVKTLSVDNKIALVTGANFSNSNNDKGFFDLAFYLKGDVLKSLDYDFVQTWISYVKSEDRPVQWGQHLSGSRKECNPILLTRSKANPKITSLIQKNSMTDAIIKSVKNAKSNIEIITPNLNVTKLMDELAKAILRGVKVRIILSKGFTDFAQDLPTRGGTNAMTISRMHKGLLKYLSKKEICENLQIHWYSVDGVNAIDSPNPPANHAKFMLVDEKISFFGSANMDNQSWVNSREISLFVDNQNLAKKWTKNFYDPIFTRSVTTKDCL